MIFVRKVDEGTIDPLLEASDEAFAIRHTFRETVNGRLLQGVMCTEVACRSGAIIDLERRAIAESTYEFPLCQPCIRRPELNVEDQRLPQITSANGCLAAATTFALQKFGSTVKSEVFDAWMERKEGQSPTYEGMRCLRLKLLEAGYAIETILPCNFITSSEFLRPDSPYSYEDFVRQSLRLDPREKNRQWLSSVFTDQAFEQWINEGRLLEAKFEPFRANGQLKITAAEVTVEAMARRLQMEALQCNILSEDDSESYTHSVVVTDMRHTKSGDIIMTYFSPGTQIGETSYLSRIVEVRKASLSEAIILFDRLDFIKPVAG